MNVPAELTDIRKQIDEVDDRLVAMLARRAALVAEVARIKAAAGIETHQPARFEALLQRLKASGRELNVDESLIQSIWECIHESSKQQQDREREI